MVFRRSLLFQMSQLTLIAFLWWSKTSLVNTSKNELILPKISITDLSEGQWFGAQSPAAPNSLNLTFQNESVYVVPKAIGQMTLECNASYPIMWNLADSKVIVYCCNIIKIFISCFFSIVQR